MAKKVTSNSGVITSNIHYGPDYTTISVIESRSNPYPTVFVVLFLILFIINFFYSATCNTSTFSFSSMLYAFQEAPQIPIDWIRDFSNLQITSDWTVAFNWLRDFLNNFVMKIITAGLFICTGVVQIITYAVYFISILFGAGA